MPSRRRRSSFGAAAGMVAVASLYVAATACSTRVPGDCAARVRFEGVMYSPVYGVGLTAARAGEPVGTGDVVDCGSLDRAPTVDSVKLVSVSDVDPSIAVLVPRDGRRGWQGLYVAEDLERSTWPPALRDVVKASRHQPSR